MQALEAARALVPDLLNGGGETLSSGGEMAMEMIATGGELGVNLLSHAHAALGTGSEDTVTALGAGAENAMNKTAGAIEGGMNYAAGFFSEAGRRISKHIEDASPVQDLASTASTTMPISRSRAASDISIGGRSTHCQLCGAQAGWNDHVCPCCSSAVCAACVRQRLVHDPRCPSCGDVAANAKGMQFIISTGKAGDLFGSLWQMGSDLLSNPSPPGPAANLHPPPPSNNFEAGDDPPPLERPMAQLPIAGPGSLLRRTAPTRHCDSNAGEQAEESWVVEEDRHVCGTVRTSSVVFCTHKATKDADTAYRSRSLFL